MTSQHKMLMLVKLLADEYPEYCMLSCHNVPGTVDFENQMMDLGYLTSLTAKLAGFNMKQESQLASMSKRVMWRVTDAWQTVSGLSANTDWCSFTQKMRGTAGSVTLSSLINFEQVHPVVQARKNGEGSKS